MVNLSPNGEPIVEKEDVEQYLSKLRLNLNWGDVETAIELRTKLLLNK
jgi:hypothetical protein